MINYFPKEDGRIASVEEITTAVKAWIGEGFMKYLTQYGDLTQCRIGSGLLEYEPPLADGSLASNALRHENLESTVDGDRSLPALHAKEGSREGVLEIGMPTSYVYLTGKLKLCTQVPNGGTIRVQTAILSLRIDADYRLPAGGFRPVKITYLWQEDGQPHEHLHIAHSPNESYQIVCATKPDIKSIVLELADPQTREE